MEETRERFKGAMWFNLPKQDIYIVGAGAIGSWAALFLARSGVAKSLVIMDDDVVTPVNLAGQFYGMKDIGQLKVSALSENLKSFADINTDSLYTINIKIDNSDMISGCKIIISAVDNMKTRKILFDSWKKSVRKGYEEGDGNPYIFIDGRMSAENFQIYFITPDKIEEYEATLFNDDEVAEAPCSYKATTHYAAMLGARITQGYTNFLVNFDENDDVLEVPFMVEEVGKLYYTKTSSPQML